MSGRFNKYVNRTNRTFHPVCHVEALESFMDTLHTPPGTAALILLIEPLVLPLSQLNQPPLDELRQQILYGTSSLLLVHRIWRVVQNLRANRVCLRELGKEAVEVQPRPIGCLSHRVYKGGRVDVAESERVKHFSRHDRDTLKISVVACNGLERHGNPLGIGFAHEHQILEFRGLREVN